MAEKIRFQIRLDPEVHEQIKARSSQLHIEIGDMIQNLLAAFEIRLEHLYEKIERDGGPIESIYLENSLIQLLFRQDKEGMTNDQFEKELKRIIDAIRETNKRVKARIPEINLGDDKPDTKTKGDK